MGAAPLDYAEGKAAIGSGSPECKELLLSKFEEDTKPLEQGRRSSFTRGPRPSIV